jgi:predicted nucleotidyltransferase
MIDISSELLNEIVDTVVDAAHPEQVVLFGSRAQGTMHKDSDVDLLVIEREPFGVKRSRRQELSRIRKALWNYHVPMDILVFSQGELEGLKNSLNHVIGRALREGKIMYARA